MKSEVFVAIVIIALILITYKNRVNLETFDPSYAYKSPDQVMGRRYGRVNIPVQRIIGRLKKAVPGDTNPYISNSESVAGEPGYTWN